MTLQLRGRHATCVLNTHPSASSRCPPSQISVSLLRPPNMLFISALAVFAAVAGASAKETADGGFAYAVDGTYTNVRAAPRATYASLLARRTRRFLRDADAPVPGVPAGQEVRQQLQPRAGRLVRQDRALRRQSRADDAGQDRLHVHHRRRADHGPLHVRQQQRQAHQGPRRVVPLLPGEHVPRQPQRGPGRPRLLLDLPAELQGVRQEGLHVRRRLPLDAELRRPFAGLRPGHVLCVLGRLRAHANVVRRLSRLLPVRLRVLSSFELTGRQLRATERQEIQLLVQRQDWQAVRRRLRRRR